MVSSKFPYTEKGNQISKNRKIQFGGEKRK